MKKIMSIIIAIGLSVVCCLGVFAESAEMETKADQSAKWNRLSRNFEKREELKQKWPISWGQLKQTSLRLKKNEKSQIISTKSHRFGYPTDKYVKFKLVQSYSLYKQA